MAAAGLLADLVAIAADLDSHRQAIEWQNQEARLNDRNDLVVSLSAVRGAVIDEIAPVDDSVVVAARMGETDAVSEARLLAAVADTVRPRRKGEERLSQRALACAGYIHCATLIRMAIRRRVAASI